MSGNKRVLTEAASRLIATEPNAQLDCLSVEWNMADGTEYESPTVYYWHMDDMLAALAKALVESGVDWSDVTSFTVAAVKDVHWPLVPPRAN